jgi:hypothetical protein
MKTHTTQLFLAIALISLTGGAFAATGASETASADSMRSPVTCHTLMTERECGQFKTTLAQLKPGPALDSYLTEHHTNMQEREALCSCYPKAMNGAAYRLRKQAMLRF